MQIWETIKSLFTQSGFYKIFSDFTDTGWKTLVMLCIAGLLLYLAIAKKFEPLLLVPIAFGMLLANIPAGGVFHEEIFEGGVINWGILTGSAGAVTADGAAVTPGLFDFLYLGVKLGIYPCLIFLGVGAMTDFGPLISRPSSLLLGAAAQVGIFLTFIGANFLGFTSKEGGAIAIIGGADGPTAILTASKLAPHLLGAIAIAAYSYMALVPFIQPPIMRLLTTKKERAVRMKQLRPVGKTERIIFPIAVTLVVALVVPSATPLIGMLMLGNLMKESGVVERLVKTATESLMNISVICLGLTVGATATAESFLNTRTLGILLLGIVAFAFGTASGVLLGKFMCLVTRGKINPLIGAAGVSAVPMAARVVNKVGNKENPDNFLLMHAMGPNVAGVIGSAVAAGLLITILG
ncbi:MAG: sodium ion-translocating decarboxylase subunit beta [Clostridia bacterium]|nr:sodium ion-translocating decarboxylase subunit beta [Clostridia bacterium]